MTKNKHKQPKKSLLQQWREREKNNFKSGFDIFRYIGPGLLVTVGFIDPGNWASNFAAGSEFGYSLLWVVTLSTIMLIVLQHNVAHLGIATGLCLSEACSKHLKPWVGRPILWTAMLASISTSLAEILGGAIALEMLFDIPIIIGSAVTTLVVLFLLFSNTYSRIESGIIMLVSLIGFSFVYELWLVDTPWVEIARGAFVPSFPSGSMLVIMSVLGAVVMPHNLFLHSEVIQSRRINEQGEDTIDKALKYEFYDTLIAMIIGWAINSAMIILAASVFYAQGTVVDELSQAGALLTPMLGKAAGAVFGIALLLAGISSTVTSGMAAGTIFSGMYDEPYNIRDVHSRVGVLISLLIGFGIICFIGNPFKGLIISQAILSLQLPFTVFLQVTLTSSRTVMGKYVNSTKTSILLYSIAALVTLLNLYLIYEMLVGG